MATIDDVAKLADVSAMTVSRYINSSGYVGKKTGERIEYAIRELNFRTNRIAKSLATKASMTIALIIASITDPFYPDLVLGVEDEAYARGYNVILCNSDGKKKENEYIEILQDRYIDGIVFAHLNVDVKQLLILDSMKIASVLIDNEIDGLDTSNVTTNDVLGGYLATKHLIELGHKEIGLIHGCLFHTGHRKITRYQETFQFKIWNNRMNGYINAMREAGLAINQGFVVGGDEMSGDSEVDLGYNSMKKLLENKHRPTAIYAQNDLIAIGCVNAILEAGYSVPQDFSVVGHDGIPIGDMIYPKLTTVEQPRYVLGKTATSILIDSIRDKQAKTLQLDPKLIVKGTTKTLGL